MKSPRVLVAVLAVLCLAAISSAAIIDVTGVNYASIGGYRTYTMGAGTTDTSTGSFYYAQYTSSALVAAMTDSTVAIVSAKLVYNRQYTNSPAVQNTTTVSEPLYDYILDTGTNYNSAYHKLLTGSNHDNPVLTAARLCTQPTGEVVNNPAAGNGPYAGNQSVDITAILQDWKAGATNYSYSLGFMSSPQQWKPFFGNFLPYIEVVTAPVPEPVTMGLLLVGGIATVLRRRSKA